MEEPVEWRFDSNQVGPDEFELIFRAEFPEPWKVYSQFTGDDGPRPTEITYETDNVEKLGDGVEIGEKKEGYDEMFDTDVIAFVAKKPYIIKHKVKITDLGRPVQGYLTYMTCDDEKCLPPTDVEFSFKFNYENPIKVNKGDLNVPVPEKVKDKIDKKLGQPNIQRVDPPAAQTSTQSQPKTQNTSTPASTPDNKIKLAPTPVSDKQVIKKISIGGDDDSPAISMNNADNQKMKDPVKWDFDIKKGNNSYVLEFIANIDKGWNVYSQFSNDEGPVPTYITFEDESAFRKVGQSLESGKRKQAPDPLFDNVEVIKFIGGEQPFTITQKIVAQTQDNIKGYLTYMACDDESRSIGFFGRWRFVCSLRNWNES